MDIDTVFSGSDIDMVKNPFTKDCIYSISIFMGRNLFTRRFYFKGDVEFRNGNTHGKQLFDGENLVDVFVKVRDFCMSLK